MEKTIIYVLSVIVMILTVGVSYAAYRIHRETQSKREDIKWIIQQLQNALTQINSNNEDEILTGLQVLSVMNEPDIRLTALPRLFALTKSSNKTISYQAEVTIDKISRPPS
ncbi:MAG: hypothetical protein QOC99_378 [Acidobacteriota bacterium]|jgi:hypothetical protein|nr:hypothetical protein [Acidobacteriota bacterium]